MDIRLLNKEDAEKYQKLRLEALQVNPEAFGSTYDREVLFSHDDIKQRVEPTSEKFVVGAFEQANLVGIATFVRETNVKMRHKGHIFGMYITPKYRGAKLGGKILNEIISRVTILDGLEQITLSVVSTNIAAKKLYEKIGFELFAIEKNAIKFNETYFDEDWLVYFLL